MKSVPRYYNSSQRLCVVGLIICAFAALVILLIKATFFECDVQTLGGLAVAYFALSFFLFVDLNGAWRQQSWRIFGFMAISCLLIPFFLPFFVAYSKIKRKPNQRKKKSKRSQESRISKLAELKIGDTVTFEPPNEDPVIGIVRRINAKSTTIVSQTGEIWRVPHGLGGKIVKTSSRRTMPNKPRQLELVK